MHGIHSSDIVGYTADATTYCPHCAVKLYGAEIENEEIETLDREGNQVHPIFAGDEWTDGCTCDQCQAVIIDAATEEDEDEDEEYADRCLQLWISAATTDGTDEIVDMRELSDMLKTFEDEDEDEDKEDEV